MEGMFIMLIAKPVASFLKVGTPSTTVTVHPSGAGMSAAAAVPAKVRAHAAAAAIRIFFIISPIVALQNCYEVTVVKVRDI